MNIKTDFRGDFTTTQNDIFRDKKLSYKAVGIYLQMLSVANNKDWNYSESGLSKLHTDGIAGVKSGIQELEKNGWLSRNKIRIEKTGFFDMEYILHHKSTIEIPSKEIPIKEIPSKENHTYNKEKKNKELKDKENTDKSDESLGNNFYIPIPELIDLFKDINASYKTFFANKTERSASKSLLEVHSFEEIKERLKYVRRYNQVPFLSRYDKIYKPSDLLRNWSVMEDHLVSLKQKVNSNTLEEV